MILDFGIKDLIDILLVASIMYYIYKMMKSSGSINLFTGIIIFIVIWIVVSQVLEMRLLGTILDKVVGVGAIALIVIFQDEIKRFLMTLGTHDKANSLFKWLTKNKQADTTREDIMPIVLACMSMSKKKVGALIVIQRKTPLDDIVRTGENIDANINQRLIENIFFKNSPLHDGAMIISHKRIKAAGCILPVSHKLDIPKDFGLRHRAALGMSQVSDADIVIVSEETGGISVAHNGTFSIRITPEELERLLTDDARQDQQQQDNGN